MFAMRDTFHRLLCSGGLPTHWESRPTTFSKQFRENEKSVRPDVDTYFKYL